MRIRIAVVDEHLLFAEGVAALLKSERDFEVVGSSTESAAFFRLLHQKKPHVVLVGRDIGNGSGLEVIREIQRLRNPPRIVLIASALTEADSMEATRLGVAGVLLKTMSPRLLKFCIRKVHAGEHWVEKESIRRALDRKLRTEMSTAAHSSVLSPRELDVLRLVAAGLRNREVGAKLFISESTVKVHLGNIFSKLGIASRVELSLYAQRHSLV
jgi:DNA-binding NarL/FixJ family response regulator